MEITFFLFEIKKSLIYESPFQILLTNLNSNLKGFFMPKVPKCYFHRITFSIVTSGH